MFGLFQLVLTNFQNVNFIQSFSAVYKISSSETLLACILKILGSPVFQTDTFHISSSNCYSTVSYVGQRKYRNMFDVWYINKHGLHLYQIVVLIVINREDTFELFLWMNLGYDDYKRIVYIFVYTILLGKCLKPFSNGISRDFLSCFILTH